MVYITPKKKNLYRQLANKIDQLWSTQENEIDYFISGKKFQTDVTFDQTRCIANLEKARKNVLPQTGRCDNCDIFAWTLLHEHINAP